MRELLNIFEKDILKISRYYAKIAKLDEDDLANEGRLAAVKIFDDWNPSKGVELFPFVHERIKWTIIKVSKNLSGAVRIPTYKWSQGVRPSKTTKVEDAVLRTHHNEISIEDKIFLEQVIKNLADRDIKILIMRAVDESLEEIGATFKISKQMVHKAELKAIKKCRELVE